MEDNQDVAEDEYYSDDPVLSPKIDWFYKLRSFAPVTLLLIVTTFYLPNTVGGTISLNSGASKVEFGQGIASLKVCASSLNSNPESSFVNAIYSGTHKFSGITVSGIPTACNGEDLVIRAYDASAKKLPLFNTNKSDVLIYKSRLGKFRAGLNSTGMTVSRISSSSFKVLFDVPVSNSLDIQFISVETAEPSMTFSCQADLECKVGDTGPGGGIVFYENIEGFSCGVTFVDTCNFLEVAPSGWNGLNIDGNGQKWNPSGSAITNIESKSTAQLTSTASESIGLGAKNTSLIVTATGSCTLTRDPITGKTNQGQNTTYAACLASRYGGGGKTDWYLPAWSELNQLCKYVVQQSWVSDASACNPTIGTGSPVLTSLGFRWGASWGYWSSTESSASSSRAFVLTTNSAVQPPLGGGSKTDFGTGGQLVRPIRAF